MNIEALERKIADKLIQNDVDGAEDDIMGGGNEHEKKYEATETSPSHNVEYNDNGTLQPRKPKRTVSKDANKLQLSMAPIAIPPFSGAKPISENQSVFDDLNNNTHDRPLYSSTNSSAPTTTVSKRPPSVGAISVFGASTVFETEPTQQQLHTLTHDSQLPDERRVEQQHTQIQTNQLFVVSAIAVEVDNGNSTTTHQGDVERGRREGDGDGRKRQILTYTIAAMLCLVPATLVIISSVLFAKSKNVQEPNEVRTDILKTPTPSQSPIFQYIPSTFSPTSSLFSSTSPTHSPSMMPSKFLSESPSSVPTISRFYLQELVKVLNITNLDTLPDDSAEVSALEWMYFEDPLYDEMISDATTTGVRSSIDMMTVAKRRLRERYAVVTFYFATNGPVFWNEQYNFLSGTSICSWNNGADPAHWSLRGIGCNADRQEVTNLSFPSNSLVGTIPFQLEELISVTNLRLSGNSLTGTIPNNLLFALTDLVDLFLSENQISGTIPQPPIPSSIDHNHPPTWPNLSTFELGRNSLTGTLSDSIGHAWTSLRYFSIAYNQMHGSIPESFGLLSDLHGFVVTENDMTGTIPPSFSALTNLDTLRIDSNQLNGTISEAFGHAWTNLRLFIINDNGLSGSIPESSSAWTKLQYFHGSYTLLTGTISSAFAAWTDLRRFGAMDNNFFGTIPEILGPAWTNMFQFNVPGNQLNGTIPESLSAWTKLEYFSVSSNTLTGTIPAGFGTIPTLTVFRIDDNQLTGNISEIFCENVNEFAIPDLRADCSTRGSINDAEIICSCCSQCY